MLLNQSVGNMSLNSSPCWDKTGTVNFCTPAFILTFISLTIIDILVVFGNTLVILAVILIPRLRSVTNLLILSLAVSDWLLGILVLPYSLTLQVMNYWVFGTIWCPIWLAVDVWLCTASILNLCVISFDRYLAITKPMKYPTAMTHRRGKLLIALVWVLSFIICFPPLIGWNDKHSAIFTGNKILDPNLELETSTRNPMKSYFEMFTASWLSSDIFTNSTSKDDSYNTTLSGDQVNVLEVTHSTQHNLPKCELISDPSYRVYSALGSFYVPMFILIFFYWRIYLTASRTSKAINSGTLNCKTKSCTLGKKEDVLITLRVHRGGKGSMIANKSEKPKTRKFGDQICRGKSSKEESDASISLFHSRNANNSRDSDIECQSFRRIKSQEGDDQDKLSQSASNDSLVIADAVDPTVKKLLGVDQSEACQSKKRFNFLPSSNRTVQLKQVLRRIKKENKSAKTVGIIVGCFLACWAPFFTVYVIEAFCGQCITKVFFDIVFWIGYCNSLLNPCIYAMFSKDYRIAFKKLLCQNRCTRDRKNNMSITSTSSAWRPTTGPSRYKRQNTADGMTF